ncbi:MAG: cytochrome c [Microthrixaceae bacterium]
MNAIHRLLVLPALFAGAALAFAGCGGEDASPTTTTVELSAVAKEGQEIARDMGCTSCHRSGDESIAPPWEGLADSRVELSDGTVVVADEEYLRTAIVDPNAQLVKGFSGIMPERKLDEAQVAALVAYLQELGE